MSFDRATHLESQRARQPHGWGHLQRDRWRAIEAHAHHTVLDVGCANGIYVNTLLANGYDARGLDLLRYGEWSALPNRIVLADAMSLPFPDQSFDTLISFETLEHVPQPDVALREYHRVCRKNIIISVPNCETPAGLRDGGFTFHHWIDRTHVNFYTLDSLQEIVEQCGFRIRKATRINPVLTAVPMLTAFGLPTRPARAIAKVLRHVMLRQYWMSLLVVADKVG